MKDDEDVLAPVPDGESVDPPGMDEAPDAAPVPDTVAAAGYDDETDLAQPVHRPEIDYTPFASEVVDPDPGAAYDLDRDTGL